MCTGMFYNYACPLLLSSSLPSPPSSCVNETIFLLTSPCSFIENSLAFFRSSSIDFCTDKALSSHVKSINVFSTGDLEEGIPLWKAALKFYVYQLNEEGAAQEMTDGDESTVACEQWMLPAAEFEGYWQSLYYDTSIKDYLLQYATTALLFSDKRVNPTVISCNRVVLLHGPPGTGKTTLCKALAQKLAIRFSHRFQHGVLVEINAHSLFSKWFSESGKLIMKLFQKIMELIEDKGSLVLILIDEVESLAAARSVLPILLYHHQHYRHCCCCLSIPELCSVFR